MAYTTIAPPQVNGRYKNGTHQNGHHVAERPRTPPPVMADGAVPEPHNIDAEQALLGRIMNHPSHIQRAAQALDENDFFFGRHKKIFEAIVNTDGDYLSVCEYFDGNPAHVTDLMLGPSNFGQLDKLIKIVKRASVLRRLIRSGVDIVQLAYANPGDMSLDEILDEAGQSIFSVMQSKPADTMKPISAGVEKVIDRAERISNGEELAGIPTGIKDLDTLLGGLRPSKLYIFAGRPGMGKSTLAHQIMFNLGKAGQRPFMASYEMEDDEIAERLIAMETGLDSHKIGLGQIDDCQLFYQGAETVAKLPIIIDDNPRDSVNGIRNKARMLQAQGGIDLLLVDYLQLMDGMAKKSENRQQEISYISRNLKLLAKELGIPVVALSQLSRACESRTNKRPILSDLRESGSIEQDADAVIFMYRDEIYDPDTEFPNIAEIIIGKHRHGPTGTFSVYFKKRVNQFTDLEVRTQRLDYD